MLKDYLIYRFLRIAKSTNFVARKEEENRKRLLAESLN